MNSASRRIALLLSLFCLAVTGLVIPTTAGTAHAALPAGTSVFKPVDHVRVADTRAGHQFGYSRMNTTTVRVGLGTKVPANATAVVLNVTSWNTAGFGGVTVFPHGEAVPGTPHVVVTKKGQIRSNMVHVRIGQLRSVDLKVSITMGLTVDLIGVYTAAAPSGVATAGRFVAMPGDRRVLNARSVPAKGSVAVDLSTVGVPKGAGAAVITLSTESGGKGGWSAFAMGTKLPGTLDLWLDAVGQRRSNQTIVKLRPDHAFIRVFSQAGGKVSVDVVGYYTGSTPDVPALSDGLFVPLGPTAAYRRLDTRAKSRLAPMGPTTIEFTIGTAVAMRSVVGNIRVLDSWDAGTVTTRAAGAGGTAMPAARAAAPRENFSESFYARTSSRGVAVSLNRGAHVVVDLAGWFLGSRPTATTAATKANLVAATPATYLRWRDAGGAHLKKIDISPANDSYTTTVVADRGNAVGYKGLSTLGKTGNTMLFAHRTNHGGIFRYINTIALGSTFSIRGANGKWHNYRVVSRTVTTPSYAGINRIATPFPPVTAQLVACSKPDGTPTSTSYRIVVTGVLVSVTNA
ncbi:MAG: sortase domain-bontaining protein [Ilumatobacteraceae bacterium]